MDTTTPQKPIPPHEVHEERKKLKWFLGFLLAILVITVTTDVVFSFFSKPYIPKERNPFTTIQPTLTPTPYFKSDGSFSSESAILSPSPFLTPLPTKPVSNDQMTQCAMDAKECSDGTFVGRSGPNCAFIACPKRN